MPDSLLVPLNYNPERGALGQVSILDVPTEIRFGQPSAGSALQCNQVRIDLMPFGQLLTPTRRQLTLQTAPEPSNANVSQAIHFNMKLASTTIPQLSMSLNKQVTVVQFGQRFQATRELSKLAHAAFVSSGVDQWETDGVLDITPSEHCNGSWSFGKVKVSVSDLGEIMSFKRG